MTIWKEVIEKSEDHKMPINIVDANNYFRRGFEAGKSCLNSAPQLNFRYNFLLPLTVSLEPPNAKPSTQNYKAKRDTQTPTDNGFFTYLSTIREELLPNCYNCIILQVDGWRS